MTLSQANSRKDYLNSQPLKQTSDGYGLYFYVVPKDLKEFINYIQYLKSQDRHNLKNDSISSVDSEGYTVIGIYNATTTFDLYYPN